MGAGRLEAGLLLAGVVLAGVALNVVSPRGSVLLGGAPQFRREIRADEGKLMDLEEGLMGMEGGEAMRKSLEAQRLQTRISQLKVQAQRGAERAAEVLSSPARVQSLTAASTLGAQPLPQKGTFAGGKVAWNRLAEERGSFLAKAKGDMDGSSLPQPLDETRTGLSVAHEEAAILARNLALASKQKKLPSLHVPVPHVPTGHVTIHKLKPGAALPRGAKVLSPEQMSSLRSAGGAPMHNEQTVGSTGFTPQQLEVYAQGLKVKALMELHTADKSKAASTSKAARGQRMMMQGWKELQEAEHLPNSATSLSTMAKALSSEANAQLGHAEKWIKQGLSLKLNNGAILDTAAAAA